jgi:hypothetical protein
VEKKNQLIDIKKCYKALLKESNLFTKGAGNKDKDDNYSHLCQHLEPILADKTKHLNLY